MFSLKIIIASTREGRKGPAIAAWVEAEARSHAEFECQVLDLAIINLPFLDEPHHPNLKRYTKQHTKDWSAIIESGDAFIAVTPEYNHGFPATLKNALDTVYQEWNNKPIAFVSYGGLAGGTRAVQLLQPVVQALQMFPVLSSVNIPFFSQHLDASGKFIPNEKMQGSISMMFADLLKWTQFLKDVRDKK